MRRGPGKRARPADVGRLAHRVIADLLTEMSDGRQGAPGWQDVLHVVDARLDRDGYQDRAARQLIATAVLAYLRTVPREPWVFLQAELPAPGARLDVVWRHRGTDELLVDEVKTGHGGSCTQSARDQAQRYASVLSADGRTARVRIIATRTPGTWSAPSLPRTAASSTHDEHNIRPPPPR